jgi:hypothetical protein
VTKLICAFRNYANDPVRRMSISKEWAIEVFQFPSVMCWRQHLAVSVCVCVCVCAALYNYTTYGQKCNTYGEQERGLLGNLREQHHLEVKEG